MKKLILAIILLVIAGGIYLVWKNNQELLGNTYDPELSSPGEDLTVSVDINQPRATPAVTPAPTPRPPTQPVLAKPLLKVVSATTAGFAEDPAWQQNRYPNCQLISFIKPSGGRYQGEREAEFEGRLIKLSLLEEEVEGTGFSRELCTRDGSSCFTIDTYSRFMLNGTSLQMAAEEVQLIQLEDGFKFYAENMGEDMCLSKV
jgi:hypothetical protein